MDYLDKLYDIIDRDLKYLLKILYKYPQILYVFKSNSFIDLLGNKNAKDDILNFLKIVAYTDYNDDILPTFYSIDCAFKFLKELYDNNIIRPNISFSTVGEGDLILYFCPENNVSVNFSSSPENKHCIYYSKIVDNEIVNDGVLDVSLDNFITSLHMSGFYK